MVHEAFDPNHPTALRAETDAHQQDVGLALLDACGAPRARRGDELPAVTEWGCV